MTGGRRSIDGAVQAVVGYIRGTLRLAPGDGDRWAPIRVGLGVAIPSLALLVFGHEEFIIYAVFGAFAGMYGRGETHQLRLIHQSQAAVLLIAGVSVGVALSDLNTPEWALITVESLFAAAGSVLADRARLCPGGPFFGIFALGACASVEPLAPPWVPIGVSMLAAVFAITLGFAGWVRHRTWRAGSRRTIRPLRGHHGLPMMRHAATYMVAVASAGVFGMLIGLDHAYWAMASAAVPLAAAELPGRISRGVHRVLGTFSGLILTALILWADPSALWLAIPVILLQFPTEFLMIRNYGFALTFFTPMILLMTQLANPIPRSTLLIDRGIETLLGAVIGITVVMLVGYLAKRRVARMGRRVGEVESD
ncbi:FUSC family protein [Brevibacterium sp. 'Marine']|uniref:FUSC family protein n=1 Tax=Brevibacterium sp. 'Marine' TaxID=2725563 RepID=UPI00145E8DEB|nr:FUSC family protein [Brevibacterium sp. 'Marine']